MIAPADRDIPAEIRPYRKFSPRQHELLDLMASGLSVTVSARLMGISPRTARAYVEVIAQRIPNPGRLPPLRLVLDFLTVRRIANQQP
jgi:DNA-binding CsgD family transcriptional regulator